MNTSTPIVTNTDICFKDKALDAVDNASKGVKDRVVDGEVLS